MPSPRELNSPACMLARLAFVLHLACALAAFILAVGALGARRPAELPRAAALGAASALLAWTLRRSGWYVACRESFASLGLEPAPDADPELDSLLARRSAMEDRRGTPAFDPWELLALQHEIDEHVRARPAASAERAPSGREAGR